MNLNFGTNWRVFISSTSVDLKAEREAVEKALNQLRGTEFVGMEYFGSQPDKPNDVCLKEVSQCQVYVGIFARRYGYVDTNSQRSMTELEYRQAKKSGIPCLIYIKDPDTPVPNEWTESEPTSRVKLEDLTQELKREHVVTFFKNPDHLATRVVIDLHNLVREKRQPQPTRQIRPSELLLLLTMHFDLEELRTLCFELGVDYDDLRGEGKKAKARELIAYLERRQQLNMLIEKFKELRPMINWD